MEGMERSEFRKLQKEQERERRRLRDRQRRQSMSVEEREKHLARRRRNYQLRRLRAGNALLGSDSPSHSHSQSQHTATSTDQPLALPSVSVSSDPSVAQCDDDALPPVGSHQVSSKSQSLEVPAHKLAKFSGQQLRLNRLKHLARSLNDPVGDNCRMAADVIIKTNEVSNGISAKGLRFNRVKNLARSLNSAVKETSNQNLQTQTEGWRML